MPYGEKSEDELLEYADYIIKFFLKRNAKAVVMACNTTSSVIYDKIKNKYGVKIYPIIQSVAGILAGLPIKRIGVFATPATVKSGVYKKEIQKHNPNMEVLQIACPEWVKVVEENRIDDEKSLFDIKSKLDDMLEFLPEKIVLGCTHYPFLTKILAKYVPQEKFIDPAVYFAEFIKNYLSDISYDTQGTEEIYVSAEPEKFMQAAKMFYKLDNLPQKV